MHHGATTRMSSHFQTNSAAKIWWISMDRFFKEVYFPYITFLFLIRNVELITYQRPIGGGFYVYLEDTALIISQFLMVWLKRIWLLSFKRSFSGVSFPYIIIGIQVRNDQDMMSTLITSCRGTAIENYLYHLIFDIFTAPKRVAWF